MALWSLVMWQMGKAAALSSICAGVNPVDGRQAADPVADGAQVTGPSDRPRVQWHDGLVIFVNSPM